MKTHYSENIIGPQSNNMLETFSAFDSRADFNGVQINTNIGRNVKPAFTTIDRSSASIKN